MNKKNKIGIFLTSFFIFLLILIICILVNNSKPRISTNTYQEQVSENVRLTVKYDKILNRQEYENISAYIKSVHNIPDGFNRIAKLTIQLKNDSKYTLSGLMTSVHTDKLFMIPECTQFEPTAIIHPKSNIEIISYIYLNDELNTDSSIKTALTETDLKFLFYIDNNESPLEPYKIYVKGEWK